MTRPIRPLRLLSRSSRGNEALISFIRWRPVVIDASLRRCDDEFRLIRASLRRLFDRADGAIAVADFHAAGADASPPIQFPC